MSERLTRFFASHWGIILAGAVIGVLAPLLQKLGNPAKAEPAYGRWVVNALGIPMSEVRRRTGEACGRVVIRRRVQDDRETRQEPPRLLAYETTLVLA